MLNKQTVKKLQDNPFYRMSTKQKIEAGLEEEEATFGVLPKHNTALPKHPTRLVKKAR